MLSLHAVTHYPAPESIADIINATKTERHEKDTKLGTLNKEKSQKKLKISSTKNHQNNEE